MADKCEAYRALIEEGAGGAATGPALSAHLAACAACREFRRGREALVGLIGGLERVSAPDDFEFRLRARMAARNSSQSAPLRRLRLAPALTAAAVAACLLVAASISLRNDPPAAPPVAVQEAPPAAVQPAPAINLDGTEPTAVRVAEQGASRRTRTRAPTFLERGRGYLDCSTEGGGEAVACGLETNKERARQTWGLPRPFQCVVTVLTPATTETEDPPTVSLAPQYTSQCLCQASLNLTRLKSPDFAGIFATRPRRDEKPGAGACNSYTAHRVFFSRRQRFYLPPSAPHSAPMLWRMASARREARRSISS